MRGGNRVWRGTVNFENGYNSRFATAHPLRNGWPDSRKIRAGEQDKTRLDEGDGKWGDTNANGGGPKTATNYSRTELFRRSARARQLIFNALFRYYPHMVVYFVKIVSYVKISP